MPNDPPRFLLDPPPPPAEGEAAPAVAPVPARPAPVISAPVPAAPVIAAAPGELPPLFGVAVSDRDRFIAAAHGNGLIGMWQPELASFSGVAPPLMTGAGHEGSARAVAFDPDGSREYTRLASGGVDGTIRLWDLGAESSGDVFTHHTSSVMCLAFDPSGTRLISGSEDRTVVITHWPSGTLERRLVGHAGTVLCVAVSPDGRTFASGGFDGMVSVWSIEGGPIAYLEDNYGAVWGAHFVAPDHLLYTSGQSILEWRPDSRPRVLYELTASLSSITAFAVRRDGKELAFAVRSELYTMDLRHRAIRQRTGHDGDVNGVAYLGDGRIASSSDDGELFLWGRGDTPELRLHAASAPPL